MSDHDRFYAALYAQCPEPVADDIKQRFEALQSQLATAQARGKAWEEYAEVLRKAHEHLMVIYRYGQVRGIARRAYETPRPQSVKETTV